MTDHLADIKKFAKKPVNEAALAGLEKTYRLVLEPRRFALRRLLRSERGRDGARELP